MDKQALKEKFRPRKTALLRTDCDTEVEILAWTQGGKVIIRIVATRQPGRPVGDILTVEPDLLMEQ
jgi:hypothetical protein